MTYVWLISLAMIFTAFGYLLHAFFGGRGENIKLNKEISLLKTALQEKQNETREVQEEIAKTSEMIGHLEQQLRQRNNDVETLQSLAVRQDEEIDSLKKDTNAILMAVVGSEISKPVQNSIGSASPLNAKAEPSPSHELIPHASNPTLSGASVAGQSINENNGNIQPENTSDESTWLKNLDRILGGIKAGDDNTTP
jgi:hypothetical protein